MGISTLPDAFSTRSNFIRPHEELGHNMKIFVAAAAAALISTTAMAHEPGLPTEPQAIVPVSTVYDWTGGYGGLSLGAPLGTNMFSASGGASNSSPGAWTGARFGGTLGYDRQRGNLVFGAALDITGGDVTATSTTSGTFSCVGGCVTTLQEGVALRGRIGMADDRNLVYFTAGAAQARVATSAIGVGPLATTNQTGWTAGFGVERAVRDNLSIGLEYLFTDLGTQVIPSPPCSGGCFTDIQYGTLRLSANFRW
tara:strand:+ start:14 stop:775 length:762 start_codon:yes stop_codon:yes gene_type:complete